LRQQLDAINSQHRDAGGGDGDRVAAEARQQALELARIRRAAADKAFVDDLRQKDEAARKEREQVARAERDKAEAKARAAAASEQELEQIQLRAQGRTYEAEIKAIRAAAAERVKAAQEAGNTD